MTFPNTKIISRRGCLKAGLNLMAGSILTALGASVYATEIEPRWIKVDRIRVPIRTLPPAFDGYRIVQLSDIHLGHFTRRETIAQAIETALELKPDLIVMTGDYVLDVMDMDGLHTEFSKLAAHGHVFAILGNHDHWMDAASVRIALTNAGIPELRNAGQPVIRGEQAIWLTGVDDIWERQHDLSSALADVPTDAVAILLAHEPDFADESTLTNRIALQLSGHSHGGQVRIPGVGAPILPYLGRKYPYGLRRIGSMWLYTNRGVGVIPPTVRVNCRPEVAEITLCRA
ncbi:MAG: metallophosphoesterase [Anaerolineae bacterium]|nr:metallophosphoesterase [Anaerolineae bacterium]